MAKTARLLVGAGVVAGCFVAGALSAAALVGEETPAPPPLSAFPNNAAGQSYGSSSEVHDPDGEPDLISAVATDGTTGYVLKKDLERVDGTEAMRHFRSPEEALEWQAAFLASSEEDRTIPVYARDGLTVVGSFTVSVAESSAEPRE